MILVAYSSHLCFSLTERDLTVSIQHHQTRHHQHRVPVKLQKRAIPGKTSSPGPTPQTHKQHTQKPKTDTEYVERIEGHRQTHLCAEKTNVF